MSWRGLFGGGGDYRRAPRRGWGQDSLIADQVGSGDRHQSRQLLHQLQESRHIHPGPRVYAWYAEEIAREVENRWLR